LSDFETSDEKVSIHVFKTSMSDDSIKCDLGVIELPGSCGFASARNYLQKYMKTAWKYSIPELGILSSKQEIDLGPVVPILRQIGGKEDLELLLVEQV
jgi:hypothetical protein